MAKSDVQNNIRRAAKQRQAAARKAKAAAEKIQEHNYRANFKFVRNDRLEETLKRQEIAESVAFGKAVDQLIHHWLNSADNRPISINPSEENAVYHQAFRELTAWLANNTDQYGMMNDCGLVRIGRVRKAA